MNGSPMTVFISYARNDQVAAKRIYDRLILEGIEPWIDSVSLLPGQEWRLAITNAIRESRYFLALLSSNSVGRRGFVQREIKEALELFDEFPEMEIYIIPVRLDECNPSHERLRDLHYVDLFPSWDDGFYNLLRVFQNATFEKGVSNSFKDILSSNREEDIQRFLTKHDKILLKTFCSSGTYICIPKFRFGNEYISDFILIQLWSTLTKIIFIELEPSNIKPFTKQGNFSQRLNGAIQQINDWYSWIRENNDYFCNSIVKCVRQRNVEIGEALSNRIRYNSVTSKIIIGRRSMLTERDNSRRTAFNLENNKFEILPYDRLLDVSKEITFN